MKDQNSNILLCKIIDSLHHIEEKSADIPNFIIAYPNDGTFCSLEAGTTTFNFESGKISDVTGTISSIQRSLSHTLHKFLKSIYIKSNKDIIIKFDNAQGSFNIKAGQVYRSQYIEFTQVSIICTETTNILIIVSTNPNTDFNLSAPLVIQGLYNKDLKTVAIDADGRIKAFIEGQSKLTGNLIFHDDFSNPIFNWDNYGDIGYSVSRCLGQSHMGIGVMRMIAPGNDSVTAYKRVFTKPSLKVKFNLVYKSDDFDELFKIEIRYIYVSSTTDYQCMSGIRYNSSNNKFYYISERIDDIHMTWTEIPGLVQNLCTGCWHIINFSTDFNETKHSYIELITDEIITDMSMYNAGVTTDSDEGDSHFYITVNDLSGSENGTTIYVDDVTIISEK